MMSVVNGKTKKYPFGYVATIGMISSKLNGLGKELPEGRGHGVFKNHLNKLAFHIGNSTIILRARENNEKGGTYFSAGAIVFGEDHESVREQVRTAFKDVGLGYLNIRKYVPNYNSDFL
jgi:hypothetical protein